MQPIKSEIPREKILWGFLLLKTTIVSKCMEVKIRLSHETSFHRSIESCNLEKPYGVPSTVTPLFRVPLKLVAQTLNE
jgi:hypothetical protein